MPSRFPEERDVTGDSSPGSIADALAHLRARSPTLLEDISAVDRVLWVGSGVSYGQVPGLEVLLRRVLEFLQERIDGTPVGADFREALEQIVRDHLPGELAAFQAEPTEWTIPTDLKGLVNSYSTILGTEVGEHPHDYLLWDAVNVRETYGAPSLEPGAQHRLIAYLVHEGLVEEIVTTNWDGLIERAVEESSGPGQPQLLDD